MWQTQKEFKSGHNCMRNVIHWELCQKLKLDHTSEWYVNKPESVLANDTHKNLWDLEIQTNQLMPARRPDLALINKKKLTNRLVGFAELVDHRVKIKESEKEISTLTFQRTNSRTCEWQISTVAALGTVP